MMDSAAGVSSAAPIPCPARAAISAPADGASPLARDAAVNTARPVRNVARRPTTSDARPPSSTRPPLNRTYAVTTHCRSLAAKWSARPIEGSATFTTVASRDHHELGHAQQDQYRPRPALRRRRGVPCGTALGHHGWFGMVHDVLRRSL